MMQQHDQAFKPSGKLKSSANFEYISDPIAQVPNRKTGNGVMTGPKNFLTT